MLVGITSTKREQDSAGEAAWRFKRECLCSLLFLPLTRLPDLRLPAWVRITRAAAGSSLVRLIPRNCPGRPKDTL